MPVLLRSREIPLQVVLAVAAPAAAGAIAGWLLGVNEIAYIVWSVLALLGGFFAGLEHDGAREGAIRGVLGGALFGAVLLLVHQALGDEPKAKLPDPEVVLVVLTALIGTVSGALGGRRRAKHEGEMAEAQQEENEGEQGGAEQTGQQQAARREAKKGRKAEKADGPAFSIKRLHWYEYLGFLGSIVLGASLFLPWFSTSCMSKSAAQAASKTTPGGGCNPNSVYNGARGDFTAFQTFKYLDWLLVAACVAPFILAYIIARGHSLSWKPGEVTMIVGMIAFALILLNGVILGKPGDTVDMNFEIGWLVGLLGAAILMAAGTLRQALHADAAKPPGVM